MNRAWLIAKDTITQVDAFIVKPEGLSEYSNVVLSEVIELLGPEGVVNFFFPSEWVSFIDIVLPEVKPSLLETIIPNLLEEFLAEPIESIHWAIARDRQTKEGKTTVAIIQRTHMENMVNMCHTAGLTLEGLYPDVYVVPVFEEGWACWVHGLRMAVRQNMYHGFSLRQSESANWFASVKVPEKTLLYGDGEGAQKPVFSEWIAGVQKTLPMINLMQGEFEPRLKKAHPHRLKHALYALGAAVVCYFAFLVIDNMVLWHQLRQLRAETLALYQEVIPGATQATSPRVVFEREMSRRGVTDQSFFVLLTSLSQALSRSPGIVLVHLQYEGDQITATVEATDFAALDAWTGSFQGASMVFKQEGAEQADGHVTARIRIEEAHQQ